MTSEPEFVALVARLRKNNAVWDMPGFSLPSPQYDELSRACGHRARIEIRGNARTLLFAGAELPLSDIESPMVECMLDGDCFDTDTVVDTFPDATPDTLRVLLGALVGLGVIEPIAQHAC